MILFLNTWCTIDGLLFLPIARPRAFKEPRKWCTCDKLFLFSTTLIYQFIMFSAIQLSVTIRLEHAFLTICCTGVQAVVLALFHGGDSG